MISLALTLVLVAALVATARRRRRRANLRRAAGARAGGSPERAIYVRDFAEIDDHLTGRWCLCGGYLERTGEGTRETGGHRYRIARLRCLECERVDEVFFDTTEIVH
ncbi:MAG: hypothetical protein ACREQL_12885 [Candidatus Binatia bacterium]